MKRILLGLVIGLLVGTAGTALAANSDTVQAVFSKYNLKINQNNAVEIEPIVYKSTTYLPVREVANMLGYDVTYKADSRTIELTVDEAEQPQQNEKDVDQVIDTPVNLDEWIELRGFAVPYKLIVEQNRENSNILEIKKEDGTIMFTLDSLSLNEGIDIKAITPENKEIRVLKFNGITFLNIEDLRNAGLLD